VYRLHGARAIENEADVFLRRAYVLPNYAFASNVPRNLAVPPK
jgi:hypothetical protein